MDVDIRSLIADDAAVQALASNRVFWGMRPQGGKLPAVTLMTISRMTDYVHSGPDGLAQTRIQADCYAGTLSEAKALAGALSEAVSGYRGVIGTTNFLGVFLDGERDRHDAGPTETSRLYSVIVDIICYHRSAPA